ncbi:MAG: sulfur relay protein TusB/DsrH [Glaciecola sp.]|jgi:sulfur relay protein TusB/DsrH|uniref:DsrH/TusB family sulfur metabolism protein n=1 Tax=Congregibacter sp. TaxID=2744308 RepID=UPI0039E5680C
MSSASEGTLHCLSASSASAAGRRLLAQIERDQTVLLLGKAVVLAAASHPELPQWIASGVALYALEDDLQAYAVTELHPCVIRTDYAGWVALSESHRTQTLWR